VTHVVGGDVTVRFPDGEVSGGPIDAMPRYFALVDPPRAETAAAQEAPCPNVTCRKMNNVTDTKCWWCEAPLKGR